VRNVCTGNTEVCRHKMLMAMLEGTGC